MSELLKQALHDKARNRVKKFHVELLRIGALPSVTTPAFVYAVAARVTADEWRSITYSVKMTARQSKRDFTP